MLEITFLSCINCIFIKMLNLLILLNTSLMLTATFFFAIMTVVNEPKLETYNELVLL
jgi:hypothetical protein